MTSVSPRTKYLGELIEAQGLKVPANTLEALVAALASNPQILSLILPFLLTLLQNASGGGAGKPGELPPVPPPVNPPGTPPVPPSPPVPPVDSGERAFIGLKGHYGNFQEGKSGGGVRSAPGRGIDVFENGANIYGPDKTKFIAYLTPIMEGDEGLQPGDDENDDIEVDYYGIIWDGQRYTGDEIGEKLAPQGILINNMDSSNGMNPRVVIDGVQGSHKFAVFASVNGHEWVGKTLNIGRQK